MCKGFALALLVAALTITAQAQSLSGIKLGDAPNVLEKLNLESVAHEEQGAIKTVKFLLTNGNELSVTYNSRENRVIYIEQDWTFKPQGAATDIPAFKFGTTTLEDIRRVKGSNGFCWKNYSDKPHSRSAYHVQRLPFSLLLLFSAESLYWSTAPISIIPPSHSRPYSRTVLLLLRDGWAANSNRMSARTALCR